MIKALISKNMGIQEVMKMTNELVINGKTYEFNFGMGYLRQVDPLHTKSEAGITQNIGLVVEMAKIMEGDIVALFDTLRMANRGFNPRLEQADFDAWIEDDNTDIDEVFKTVEGFFENSNCCRIMYKKLIAEAEQ